MAPYRRFDQAVHGVAIARGHFQNQLNALIDRPGRRRVAQKFAAHLAVEFPAIFTFLLEPEAIDATNWRAEHALRPAVVTRKVCGGNRSSRGAHTQEVVASVLRTIQQRDLEAATILPDLLRAAQPIAPADRVAVRHPLNKTLQFPAMRTSVSKERS